MHISVIMATYNGERFLAETIESVLAQTFGDFEFVIIEDGSTDRTAAILADYEKRDERIRVFRQDNQGIASALNRAVSLSRAPWLAHIDQDDRALPGWLQAQLDFLGQHPECSVVSSYAFFIDSEGRRLGRAGNPVDVAKGRARMNPSDFLEIVHSTVLMKRSDILDVGGYRTPDAVADRDLWGRVVTSGRMIRCNSQSLVEYRLHGGATTIRKRTKSEVIRSWGIDVNIMRRMRGQSELSPTELESWYVSRNIFVRLNQQRIGKAKGLTAMASRKYAERRWLAFYLIMAQAITLRPLVLITRIVRKLYY